MKKTNTTEPATLDGFKIGDKVKDLSGIIGTVTSIMTGLVRVAFDKDGKGNWRDLDPKYLTLVNELPAIDGFTPGELPETINYSEFGGNGLFYIRNDKFNINGLDIAEMTTNNPVEYQQKMAAELVTRYNEYPRLFRENQELRRVLLLGLSFLADLNGSEWVKGDSAGEKDMKQRAKSLQQLFYDKQLNK